MKKSFTFLSIMLLATSALAQNPPTQLPSVPNSMPKPNVAAAPKEAGSATAKSGTATPNAPTPRVDEIKSPTVPASSAAPSTMSTSQTAGSARTADQSQQKAAPGQDSSRNEPPQQSTPNQLNGTQHSQSLYPSPNLPLQQQGGPTAQPLQNRSSQGNSQSTQSQQPAANALQSGNAGRSGSQSSAAQNSAGMQGRSDAANRLDNRGQLSESRDVMQREDRNATDRSAADRSAADRSAADRSGRTAFRPNDLRAPDLGLWFDRSARDGLVISDIATRGAIANLGFREGDRIVSVNGHRIAREADFIQYLIGTDLAANAAVATQEVPVVISRDGQEQTIQVEPSLLMADYGYAAPVDPLEQFGLVLDDRTPDQLVVWRVLPRSPAYYAGFRSGDVLTTFHDQPIRSADEFQKTLTGSEPGEVGVQVRRGERTRDLQVDMPRFDRQAERRTAMRQNTDAGSAEQSRQSEREQNRTEERNSTPRLDPFRANR